jgi:protein-tyrosine phosphatase
MRHLVAEQGLDGEIEVDSAGTGNWHAGESADRRAAAAALRRGVQLEGVARQVTPEDFEEFDLILAMDSGHLAELRRMAPPGTSGRVRMFTGRDVPDPYYGGERGFDDVLDLVEAGCADLLDEVRPR